MNRRATAIEGYIMPNQPQPFRPKSGNKVTHVGWDKVEVEMHLIVTCFIFISTSSEGLKSRTERALECIMPTPAYCSSERSFGSAFQALKCFICPK